MPKTDPRVDAYIAKVRPFARPILTHLREIVHTACPDVEETIKWGMPAFTFHGSLCSFAAFKEHCTFGFWKGSLVVPESGHEGEAMGQLGRITRIEELPSRRVLTGYVKKAMKLNIEGVQAPHLAKRKSHPAPTVPEDLKKALARNKKARNTFEAFPPGQRREYVDWITEAKTEPTRLKRLKQAIEWLAEGKRRNWKYEAC